MISDLGKVRHNMKAIEIDYHANTIVISYQGYIIQTTGQCSEVKALPDEVLLMENIPIVDAIIIRDCPYSMKTYLMVANN